MWLERLTIVKLVLHWILNKTHILTQQRLLKQTSNPLINTTEFRAGDFKMTLKIK